MKTILSSRRHHYLARASIFLIALALIAGTVSCGVVVEYDLTIASDGPGSVTAPGDGTFPYDEGTMVDLVATPDDGCRFVGWTGDASTIDDTNAATTTITVNGDYAITANFEYIPMIAAGEDHMVGLKSDGTVVAMGGNYDGQCNVSGWTDITQISAGYEHTVGLKSNGKVVAVGNNWDGQCDVGNWTDITQVAACEDHTLGVMSNGTVLAVGYIEGEDISGWFGNWTDIVQVAAGFYHIVGLKSDGTVVAEGWDDWGECNVSGWAGITQVAAGCSHTAGLRSDGTVVAVGDNEDGQRDVGNWTEIVQVDAG
ncbi:MAG: hypothetical protein OEU97_05630, partial [Dehalococcoidia bacterium]|nr:hypothetical protein [Dehalococcoidia bacterium]